MPQPLAERVRPQSLDEYIGQKHLVGKDAVLRKMIESGHVSSFILSCLKEPISVLFPPWYKLQERRLS